jgi:ABC-type Fe3+ transport system permease subunit/DNA-binding beta-propeller fold protein YncE
VNLSLLQNSLLVSGAATLLAVLFGVLAALCSCGLHARFRNCVLAAGAITLALPPFLVTNSWLHFLGHTGVWRSWFPFNIVSPAGAVWILALLTWPITLFLVWSALQQIEPSQLGADPAVTGWMLVRGILLPAGRNSLALAAMLTFVLNLNNFAVPAILQLKVLPDEVWIRFNTLFDAAGALRLSWPLIIVPLVFVIWTASRRINWPRVEQAVSAALFRRQLGLSWFACSTAFTALVAFLAACLPIIQLLTVKRTWIEFPGALAAGQSALWNSAWLSIATTLVIMALALFPGVLARDKAVSTSCNSFDFFNLFSSFLWLPFLIPGVLLGIALILIFNRPGFFFIYQSAFIVILALTIRYIVIAWISMRHALDSVDRDLLDSAQLCGASRYQVFRSILWPQIAPRVLLTGYILFLFCLWDVESTILIMPPGLETMAFRVFNLLHYGHNSQINALCLILLLLALAPLLIWSVYRMAHAVVTHHASRITGHATRDTQYAIRHALILIPVAAFLTSCSPSPPDSTSLSSHLFSHVQIIGTRGVGVGQLNKPRSVAVDASDNLFVVDMTGRVQKFASDGRFLLSWQMPQTDLGKPKGMCHDPEGNILVVEPHYQRVNKFTPNGKLLAQWGSRGTNAGQFVLPRAVAVNSHNEIFVSEYEAMERVQKFQLGGIFLSAIGHAGNGPGEFNRPEGICVDSQDRIYVADSCNHRIEIFSPDGKFIRAHGKAGKGLGELSYPYDICVDKAGRQYVCEFGNSRIQVFDANDKPLEIIGGPGAEPGSFANPWGVALDSAGNLYVADSQNHRVQKLIRRKSLASNATSLAKPAINPRNTQYAIRNTHGVADYELGTADN